MRSCPYRTPGTARADRGEPPRAPAHRRPRRGVRACSRLAAPVAHDVAVDISKRKGDSKLRSSRRRLDLDLRVVVNDEPPHDIETQAGTLPDRLGGEERFENTLADLGGNAPSVVDDADHDALPLAFRGHVDPAGIGNGIERVVDQIRPDLVDLAGEAANLGEIGANLIDN